MQKNIVVNYETKPCYKIIIKNNFDELSENIIEISQNKSRKICIVTDDKVAKFYLEEVKSELSKKFNHISTFILPNGEKSKTLSNVELLYELLIKEHFDRSDLLVALGGGVIGDLTGFGAATYLRGIDFVQIPTTLLSQVDSSIGGKTGVDFLQYKNMVGAFKMPKLVFSNTSTLLTLDDDQFSSGMGEVVKHGLIRNKAYFEWLVDNNDKIMSKDLETLQNTVFESNLIKKEVVEEDPTEKGIRALLNFGHTIGHAVEKLSDFKLFHGQCVAIGMAAAARISVLEGKISENDEKSIRDAITSFGLPLNATGFDAEEVLTTTRSDKKMSGHKLKFILLESIGNAVIDSELEDSRILEGIRSVLV